MYLLDQNLVNDHISCENADFLDDYPLRSKRIQQPIQSEIHNILANPTDRQKKGDAEYSVIDLSSVSFKNFEEMKTFFAIHFQIFFIKKNVFEKLNSIYVESVTLYENRYLREVPRDVKNTKFSSINDVSNFLKTTGQNRSSTYRCDISKIFFSYARVINKRRYKYIDDIHTQIESEVLKPIAITRDLEGNEIKTFSGCDEPLDYVSRPKHLESIVGKEIASIAYDSLDEYKDLHGFSFVAKSKHDLVMLLQQYVGSKFIHEMIIENKSLLSVEDIEKISTLDPAFSAKLKLAIIESGSKSAKKANEKGTDSKYNEFKVKGYTHYTDPNNPSSVKNKTGIEIKFVLEDNQNEYGLSFQSVYDYKKRLRELTRLSSIVRQIDIINFVNDFWKNLDSNLAKKKIDKNQYIEELCLDLNIEFDLANQNLETELMLGLYKNFADELIMVKKNKQSKKKYYIHPQYEKLESAGVHETLQRV